MRRRNSEQRAVKDGCIPRLSGITMGRSRMPEPLNTGRRSLRALAFDAGITGIVRVIFAIYNWLTVTLETVTQL